MTGRTVPVRGRRAFQELSRTQHRAQSGPIWVRFSPASDDRVAVAYAISRRVGGAVIRNRCRRRMRSIVFEVAETLPVGAYLISVSEQAAYLDYLELQERLVEAMQRAGRPR